MLPFFAWKIFSISFFISLDFYLQVLLFFTKFYFLSIILKHFSEIVNQKSEKFLPVFTKLVFLRLTLCVASLLSNLFLAFCIKKLW